MLHDNVLEPDDDEFKKMVDALFDGPKKKEKPPDVEPPKEPSSAVVEFSTQKALEELEAIRQSFLDFQESVAECAVYPFLYQQVTEFAEACMDLVAVLTDNFDPNSMSETGKEKLAELKRMRAKILSSVWQKYNNDKKEE